ncbi:sulfite reductase, ferredoxin dependent [Alkalinema pantanalense CENA528]
MVMTPDTPALEKKPSKVEGIKERSNFLREPLASELQNDLNYFSEDAIQLLKFHGSYQQDNRENRVKGQEKDYQMMLRTRSPGGFIPPQLYLTLDRLSDEYGNHTLRATTRQGFQLHGVLKKNLKATIASIAHSMGSTLAACGDVNRNVMAPPAPFRNRPEYELAREYANRIADLLTPQTGAYYEIWLDGEKVVSGEEHPDVIAARQTHQNGSTFPDSVEPIYGTHYMPRKFKICVTVPGDNSVDLFSQDLSLVVICNNAGQLQGFNIYAGGGLGRTHGKEETFARIADPIGYVEAADVYEAIKAIVATQRDYGDRTDRRHARLKYLIHEWGVDTFKAKVEEYFGKALQPLAKLPAWQYEDFLGWHEQGDGKWFVGISIENGRVKDEGELRLKSALKTLVSTYQLPMLLTPSQNAILYDIRPEDRAEIGQILADHGIKREDEIDTLVRYSMACPALPLCGLANTEAERILPDILTRIRAVLTKVGLPEEYFITRITGCPNGCARPYLAELGLVGNGPNQYQLWLGAAPNQTRLSQVYVEKMHLDDLEKTLEPAFALFKKRRKKTESFGDFCDRVGFDAIRQFAVTYAARREGKALDHRKRVTVRDEVYLRLQDAAAAKGVSMTELATEIIDQYLSQHPIAEVAAVEADYSESVTDSDDIQAVNAQADDDLANAELVETTTVSEPAIAASIESAEESEVEPATEPAIELAIEPVAEQATEALETASVESVTEAAETVEATETPVETTTVSSFSSASFPSSGSSWEGRGF